MKRDDLLIDGPARAGATVVLAHGAGAPMDSPFMNVIAAGLAAREVRAVRFEFPYMQRRRTEGKRPGPDRPAVLQQTWQDMIELLGRRDLGPMITHRFALGDFLEAMAVAQDPSAGAKVMIEID